MFWFVIGIRIYFGASRIRMAHLNFWWKNTELNNILIVMTMNLALVFHVSAKLNTKESNSI